MLSLLGALVLAVACQRELQPPPVSYKPPRPHAAAIAPVSLAPAGTEARVQRTALLAPPAASPKAPDDDAPATGRDAVQAPPARPPGLPFEPGRPCFSEGQMLQARLVLFSEDPGEWATRWQRAINGAFYELQLPCTDEDFLALVLATVQLESAVTVDPGLENPDLEALFAFHLAELRRESPLRAKLLDYSGLDDAMRAKLRADTAKGQVRTEGDLVRYVEGDLRGWLRDYLQSHYFLPDSLAGYAAEQGLPNPVQTIGPMQVNLAKATRNARARGEAVESEAQMREWLLNRRTAMERGVKEGVYQLWRTWRFYRRHLPAEEAVRYTTADYNAGEFSSRNAAFQQQLSTVARRRLALDGDLLLYQGDRPAERISNTEAAAITVLSEYAAPRIRQDLLLEKTEAFSRTFTARELCRRYRRETKQACALAVVPSGAVNAVAQVKLGRDYTPANYAGAYVARWHSIRARIGTP